MLDFEFLIEFKPLNGFVTPSNAVVTVVAGITNRVEALYRRVQSIDFGTTADPTAGGPPLLLAAVATSGLGVRYEAVSGPANIDGNRRTGKALGRIVVRARQDGDDDFASACAERSFEVVVDAVVAPPTLTFDPGNGLRLIGRVGVSYRVEFTDSLDTPWLGKCWRKTSWPRAIKRSNRPRPLPLDPGFTGRG